MPVIPIELPAGMMRNGTPYAARGRWVDGNLIRWHDGALRPIGGWQERSTLPVGVDEVVRDIQTYATNIGNREALLFSNNSVYKMASGGAVTDRTPADFYQGDSQESANVGYGAGAYGAQPYGVPRSIDIGSISPVDRVVHDMWGENCLFATIDHNGIYEHIPEAPGLPVIIPNAPTEIDGLVVTDQRIVMVIKNSPEIRTVIWSDRENNNEWTPAVDNYAGSQVLQGNGKLVGLYKVQGQVLVLSETDAQIARYLGAPFVYGFERVGQNCGPIYRKAVQATDRFIVWWGLRNFWIFDGTLKPLPCEVMDFLDADLNKTAASKIHCGTVSEFSEIWWYYQSQSSVDNEVDSYVVYDYFMNTWHTGRLQRTAMADRGVLEFPIKTDKAGTVWNHEMSSTLVDGAYALSGPLELNQGNRNMAVRYVLPDTQAFGDVELYFHTRQMPTDADYTHGPYAYLNPISTTGVLGREVRMEPRFLTNKGEVGTMRFDVQAVGGGFR